MNTTALAALTEAQIERDALRAALRSMSVERGWHGNPENHTLSATIFFGSVDPRPLIVWGEHGHGSLSELAINTIAKQHQSNQSDVAPSQVCARCLRITA